MSLLTWNENLNLGISSIDEQHKQIVALINKLQEAMAEGNSRRVLGEILQELMEYTIRHFTYEESLLEERHYPELEQHKKIHRNLEAKVKQYLLQLEENTNYMLGVDVMTFLTDWLVDHIQGVDRRYAPLLLKNGVN